MCWTGLKIKNIADIYWVILYKYPALLISLKLLQYLYIVDYAKAHLKIPLSNNKQIGDSEPFVASINKTLTLLNSDIFNRDCLQ